MLRKAIVFMKITCIFVIFMRFICSVEKKYIILRNQLRN